MVRRHAKTGETQLKVAGGDFERAREADIRSLLPIHAYSQKQLSSVSVRVDELTRFVTAPIKQQLDGLDRRINEVSGRRVGERELCNSPAIPWAPGRPRASILTERSLAEQAINLRKSLTGLSETDRAVLGYKPAVDRARDAVTTWDRELAQAVALGDGLFQRISQSLTDMTAVSGSGQPLLSGRLTDYALRPSGSCKRWLLQPGLWLRGSVGPCRG